MQAGDIPTPFRKSFTVLPEWLDPNGHMNVAFYLSAFDKGSDPFFEYCGIGWDYTKSGAGSVFATGCNIDFRYELLAGDALEVTTRLLDRNDKLLHIYCEIARVGEAGPAATQEALFMHVSLQTRRSQPFPEATLARLGEVLAAHAVLPRPTMLGRQLGIRR
jgi:acyl-CoA thioester hydrolase